MSLFKKKPEPRSSSPRPKLRPAGFNPTGGGDAPKSVAGSSGKGGGGQSAKPKYNPKAPAFKTQMKYFNEKGNINNDGDFGYGYIDEETGIEVPWYIDMINGGGANAAGDTFVSPFEGSMAGLPAQAVTGVLNEMNIAPYGYNRSRYYMPKQAEGSTQAAAPKRGGGSVSSTKKNRIPLSTILPILDANQTAYESAAFAPMTTSQAAASEDAYFGQSPQVSQDFSGLSSAPSVRAGLIGYSPQVTSGTVKYTPTPTQGVTDEVYLPQGTETGSGLGGRTSAQLARSQRARDYMNFKNTGGKSSYEEWLQGIYY